MTVQLNHTIVSCKDNQKSARFLTDLLGLPEATHVGPFFVVELANGVSLDYEQIDGDVTSQHYAFLISEEEFDEIFARIQEQQITYWADPFKQKPGEINPNDGGRGVYFDDPDGHLLEIITRPYGSF